MSDPQYPIATPDRGWLAAKFRDIAGQIAEAGRRTKSVATMVGEFKAGDQIAAGVDLDTLTTTGQYRQGTAGNATLLLHYPLAGTAGILVVEAAGTFTVQQYHTRVSGSASRTFVRQANGSTWSAWAETTDPWGGSARPAFHVKHNTTFVGSGAQADRAMNFNTVLLNQGGCWSTVNFQFTAPVAGVYEFNLGIANTAITGGPEAGVYKNGVFYEWLTIAYYHYLTCTGTLRILLAAGDIIKPYWRNNNGTSVTIDGTRSHFAGHLISAS